MGFGGSAAAAILLVAAVASVGMLYTTTYNGYEQIQGAMMAEEEGDLKMLNTAVEIVNVTHNTTASPETVSVTVRNAGSSALSVADTDLLLNGTYQDDVTYTISTADGTIAAGSGGTALWLPAENLTITAEATLSEPITVKVVTGPGVAVTEVYP
ncbi:MAG: fla cluster protein FlaF [Halodesulfurarchaeum sp.]